MVDIIICALKNLSRKRLRTMLTVGSIAIGVILVVIVTMISNAGREAVNNELESLGMSGLSICSATGGTGISSELLELIRETKNVKTAMPLLIQFASSILRETHGDTMICGIDGGANQAISLSLKYGRLISRGDVKAADMVCVVDETLAKRAYGRENITGKTIYLQIMGMEEEFEIVGVTEAGSSLLQNLGEFIPSMVYVPYSTLQMLTGRETFDQVAVRIQEKADVSETKDIILEKLNRTAGGKSFRADNLSLQRKRLGGLLDIVSLILTAISAISLIVSGLGIMTIMLVSVNERMREIGIKKAIGAAANRIMLEFMTEAIVISLIGSISGIAIGGTISTIGLSVFGLNASVYWTDFALLTGFSLLIGAIFGVYPAIKAARLNPVDALRFE
ncbi:MAG: ABC transporter permease [Oscillospiraceae bacterium]|nr:ABC transporter permease [Oscillospiraceae bacterium]